MTLLEWPYEWKITFNPDITNQDQEVIFSTKSIKTNYPPAYFNDIPVARRARQKNLGRHLDNKLNVKQHIKQKISKANKNIDIIRMLHSIFLRTLRFTSILFRPDLDYCGIIYDQPP